MTTFSFVDRSSVRASAVERHRGIGYVIDDERICRVSGGHISSRSADLITIALSCYTVDRLETRGARWSRELQVEIPVSDPDFWSVRAQLVGNFLARLTDDMWTLRFIAGRRWRSAEQQLLLLPRMLDENSSLALFSGGLDSLARAARFLASSNASLVLVGVRSSYLIGRDQSALVQKLQQLWPTRVLYLRIPLRLQRAGDGEQTQRCRAFVYLTLASVAARKAGLSSISVYENGIGAYNPRVAEYQWGSQSNLSTHPETLRRFADVMGEIEMPISVLLPHRHETKAEHVASMPEAAQPLIALTSSCDSYPLRRAGITHCGTKCGSCILRRQSLLAAGLERFDRVDYADVPFERGVTTDPYRAAAWQGWAFHKLDPADSETVRLAWPSLLDDAAEEQPAVIDLFKRYGSEWSTIAKQRPHMAKDCGWPMEEQA